MKKQYFCKCGHEHEYSNWSGVKNLCKQCACSVFISRDFPKQGDKIMTVLFVISFSLIVVVLGFGFAGIQIVLSSNNPKLDEPVLSLNQILPLLGLIVLVVMLYLSGSAYSEVKFYLRKKKTPTKPLESSS